MSKKTVLALGGDALGDDLAGQMKAVKITSQAIAGLITQEYEVTVAHSNGLQVDMINQVFEAAVETKAHSPMLPMSVCVALSQGYIGYDLQSALREELFSRDTNKLVVTLVTQAEVDIDNPVFLNPTKLISSFLTEREVEQPTRQGYTLKGDADRSYRRVAASSKPVDIVEKETVKALVDAGQVVITVGGGGIPAIHEGSHLRGTSATIDRDWISARLAEMIDADMLIILTTVEKVAINFSKKNE